MTRAPWEDRINPVRMALEQALELAAKNGLPCFPCKADKRPACHHGFKQATKDADELRALWRASPGVRVGVPTGEPSGLFCLDVDSGKKPEAVQWHDKFRKDIPATRLHKTKSGGWHYLFEHQAGLKCTTSKIHLGIDTRGDGGYIVWWPAHVVSPAHQFLRAAPVPGWLIEALNPPPPPSWLSHTQQHYYTRPSGSASSRLEGILTRVASAREGERNAVTFWAACRIADMIVERELNEVDGASAFEALQEIARSVGLSHFEVKRTINSAVRI